MRTIFFLVLFLFSLPKAFPQGELDSLRNLLAPSLPDSTKISVYNELAFYFASRDPEQGLEYADSALTLSKSQGLISLEATAYNNQGVNYWYQGADSLALSSYQKALGIFQQLKNRRREAIAFNNMALISYNREDYASALDYHQNAEAIFRELGLQSYLLNSLSNTGVVFLALSDYPKALEYFLEAYSQTTDEDVAIRGNLLTNQGLVSKNMNQLDKALGYLWQALEVFQDIGKRQEEANTLANLGNVYQQMGDFPQADSLLNLALSINLQIGNSRKIASDYTNLGILYKSSGDLQQAGESLHEAQNRYQELEDRVNLSLVKLELSTLEIAKHPSSPNWQRILTLQLESAELAESARSISRRQLALEALSETYLQLGNPVKALDSYKQSVILKDSIFNDENEKKLLRLQIEYDVKANNAAILAASELEKERLKSEKAEESFRATLYLLVLIFVFVLIGVGYYLLRKRSQTRQAVYRNKIAELQLKSLRAQMDPHFIFNALNSISNFLLKNRTQDADFYLGKFAKLIRMILESSEQKLIGLSGEMELLEAYVSIESLRLGRRIHLRWDLQDDLEAEEVLIPPMLLQPLVENSIWHGFSTMEQEGEIVIRIRADAGSLYIAVIDNGQGKAPVGKEKSGNTKRQSLALKIVQERLELLGISQGRSHINSISWKSLSGGFQVELVIPDFSGA